MLTAYNDATHEATGYTPSEILFGRRLNAPGIVPPKPKGDYSTMGYVERLKYSLAKTQELVLARQEFKKLRNARADPLKATEYKEGALVSLWSPKRIEGLKSKIIPKWNGPYTVVRTAPHNKLVYYLKDEQGDEIGYPVSISRLIPYKSRESLDDLNDLPEGLGDVSAHQTPSKKSHKGAKKNKSQSDKSHSGVGSSEAEPEKTNVTSDDTEAEDRSNTGAEFIELVAVYTPSKQALKELTTLPTKRYNLRSGVTKRSAKVTCIGGLVVLPLPHKGFWSSDKERPFLLQE